MAPKKDTAFLAPVFRSRSGAISRAREERAERSQDEVVGEFVLAAASLLGGKKDDFQEEVDEGDEDKDEEEVKKGNAKGEGRESELLAVAISLSLLFSSMLARADPADVDRMMVHASPTTLRYGTSTQYKEERKQCMIIKSESFYSVAGRWRRDIEGIGAAGRKERCRENQRCLTLPVFRYKCKLADLNGHPEDNIAAQELWKVSLCPDNCLF